MATRKAKRQLEKAINFFASFTRIGALGGILLIIATVVALVWANSPWGDSYFKLWEKTYVTIGIGDYSLSKNLLHLINDGLMAMFFFLVGLEIKREVLMGELSSLRKATLPLAAAVGGMVVPALIYVAFNPAGPASDGWGIPMATDIAFALGIVALLGKRVPLSLKIFLTALAIVDDLGAVLVIALFYSSDISLLNLGIGAGVLAVMLIANLAGVRNTLFYAVLGIGGLWFAFLLSGVHATIAGVLAAFAIPANRTISKVDFAGQIQSLTQNFPKAADPSEEAVQLTSGQIDSVYWMKTGIRKVEPPLQRLEHQLHPWVMFLIMPLFALSNAGVVFASEASKIFSEPVSVGIIMGLLVGKVGGIMLFSYLAYRLKVADLPSHTNWTQLVGASLLAGIGFTMSLFITGLAFTDPALSSLAKMGILTASLIAGILGYAVLYVSGKKHLG